MEQGVEVGEGGVGMLEQSQGRVRNKEGKNGGEASSLQCTLLMRGRRKVECSREEQRGIGSLFNVNS